MGGLELDLDVLAGPASKVDPGLSPLRLQRRERLLQNEARGACPADADAKLHAVAVEPGAFMVEGQPKVGLPRHAHAGLEVKGNDARQSVPRLAVQ
jgi:hypothetical protein